jgi:hypothetical protein
MAKAKQQSESQKSKPSKKAAKSATGAEPAVPQIDTSMAAQSAASMISNRDPRGSESEGGEKRESSSFKQLKANLNKPALQGPASFLHSTAPQKKSNLPFTGRKQVGHNQTFGADVNRTGVPRRTGG